MKVNITLTCICPTPFLLHNAEAQVWNHLQAQLTQSSARPAPPPPPQQVQGGAENLHPNRFPDDADGAGTRTTLGKQLLWVTTVTRDCPWQFSWTCWAAFCGDRSRTRLLVPHELQFRVPSRRLPPRSEQGGVHGGRELGASLFPGCPQSHCLQEAQPKKPCLSQLLSEVKFNSTNSQNLGLKWFRRPKAVSNPRKLKV